MHTTYYCRKLDKFNLGKGCVMNGRIQPVRIIDQPSPNLSKFSSTNWLSNYTSKRTLMQLIGSVIEYDIIYQSCAYDV